MSQVTVDLSSEEEARLEAIMRSTGIRTIEEAIHHALETIPSEVLERLPSGATIRRLNDVDRKALLDELLASPLTGEDYREAVDPDYDVIKLRQLELDQS